jgi:hypothetical protein
VLEAALTRRSRELVGTDADVASETRELTEILSRSGAGS